MSCKTVTLLWVNSPSKVIYIYLQVGEAIACPEDNSIYEESSPAPDLELVSVKQTILISTNPKKQDQGPTL